MPKRRVWILGWPFNIDDSLLSPSDNNPFAYREPINPRKYTVNPWNSGASVSIETLPPFDDKPLATINERVDALDVLRSEVAQCVKCVELAAYRTQTVFGVGSPMPKICFVGWTPEGEEDKTGEPFVGRPGKLLGKIIEACQLVRDDFYLLNVIKCCTPRNRYAFPNEVFNCNDFLIRQLSILRPQVICCLGGSVSQALLNTSRTIDDLRGVFHNFRGIPVICTFHPAFLLRTPLAKRAVWYDMKQMMLKLDRAV